MNVEIYTYINIVRIFTKQGVQMKKNKQQEVELKLQVTDPGDWAGIVYFVHGLEQVKQESFQMVASYFDTEDMQLNRQKISYRVREENHNFIATIKAGGAAENGMHRHFEVNVPVTSDKPDLTVFKEVCVPLYKVLSGIAIEDLQLIVKTDFRREAVTVEQKNSVLEIALDRGTLFGGTQSSGIMEVEIELKRGSEQEIIVLGEALCEQFPSLCRESRSKFYRGLVLAGLVNEEKAL